MRTLFALLLSLSAEAHEAPRIRRRANTAEVCRHILARADFDLDDAIAREYVIPIRPRIYRFVGSDIDPVEVNALERLIRAKGGRALATGNVASQTGVPVIDALYYAADETRHLLSIKTSARDRTNGVSFIRSQLFRRKRASRRLTTLEGLIAHYGEANRDLAQMIWRIWGLQSDPRPRITYLLDLTPASSLVPRVSQLDDAVAGANSRARAGDHLLIVSADGAPPPGPPCALNLDLFVRDSGEHRHATEAIMLFKDHVCELNQTGYSVLPIAEDRPQGLSALD